MATSTSARKSLKTTEEVSVLRKQYYARGQQESDKKVAQKSEGESQ